MEEELAANHPDIELVDTVYGDDDDQKSFDKTAALLQNHPNLKGIISPTTVGIAAAARYLSDSDAKGKVALTGLGTPEPDARVRRGRHRRRRSRCGTRATSATSRRTPPRPWSTATSPARRATPSRPASSASSRRRRRRRPARRAVRVQRRQHRRLRLLSQPHPGVPAGRVSASAPGRHHHHRHDREVDAMHRVLLPAPGQARPDRRSTASGTRPSGPRCCGRWHETGWHNYSLFLRDDGLLIGYFETPDRSTPPWPAWHATDVNAPLAGRDGRVLRGPRRRTRPTQGFLLLDEVFHLEDQLAAIDQTTTRRRSDDDHVRRHHRPARGPGHRGPLVGLRQLRHPVQGVRHARAPRARVEEKIADAAQVHRFTGLAPSRRAAHPVGPGRRLRRAARRTPRTSASRSARSTPTPSRTTTTSSAA